MEQERKMNREQNPEKSVNPLKITAIVLSSLAAVLVLAAVGLGLYLWNSSSNSDGMFSAKNDAVPKPTVAVEQEAMIDADWIDENGNSYNYRDDVISIPWQLTIGKKKPPIMWMYTKTTLQEDFL